MADISAILTYSMADTQHHPSDFFLTKEGQGHRLSNLQDLVECKLFWKPNLHCSFVLNNYIVSLSIPNVKVTEGHRTASQVKVTGINI